MGFGKFVTKISRFELKFAINKHLFLQILGFDSLDIIPFLAIIILSFRKESLMQVNSMENIEAILADLSSVEILPLIQLSLSFKNQ